MPQIVLPTVRSEINKNWKDQKSAFIGPSGIGKSTLLSYAEKNLFLQTEAGLNHLAVMKIPVLGFEDLRDTLTSLIQAHQANKFPYETITIDTVDELIDLINEEVIKRGREKFSKAIKDGTLIINTIGDIPNGAGWQWSTELIKMTFDKLEKLPAHIIFIGHMEMKEIKTATDKYHKKTLSIGGKTGQWLMAWADNLMMIEASMNGSKQVRKIRTIPTQYMDAKSRGNIVPDGWEWGEDMKVNWEKFRSLFQ